MTSSLCLSSGHKSIGCGWNAELHILKVEESNLCPALLLLLMSRSASNSRSCGFTLLQTVTLSFSPIHVKIVCSSSAGRPSRHLQQALSGIGTIMKGSRYEKWQGTADQPEDLVIATESLRKFRSSTEQL